MSEIDPGARFEAPGLISDTCCVPLMFFLLVTCYPRWAVWPTSLLCLFLQPFATFSIHFLLDRVKFVYSAWCLMCVECSRKLLLWLLRLYSFYFHSSSNVHRLGRPVEGATLLSVFPTLPSVFWFLLAIINWYMAFIGDLPHTTVLRTFYSEQAERWFRGAMTDMYVFRRVAVVI